MSNIDEINKSFRSWIDRINEDLDESQEILHVNLGILKTAFSAGWEARDATDDMEVG